jgi:hypothetical protein
VELLRDTGDGDDGLGRGKDGEEEGVEVESVAKMHGD